MEVRGEAGKETAVPSDLRASWPPAGLWALWSFQSTDGSGEKSHGPEKGRGTTGPGAGRAVVEVTSMGSVFDFCSRPSLGIRWLERQHLLPQPCSSVGDVLTQSEGVQVSTVMPAHTAQGLSHLLSLQGHIAGIHTRLERSQKSPDPLSLIAVDHTSLRCL